MCRWVAWLTPDRVSISCEIEVGSGEEMFISSYLRRDQRMSIKCFCTLLDKLTANHINDRRWRIQSKFLFYFQSELACCYPMWVATRCESYAQLSPPRSAILDSYVRQLRSEKTQYSLHTLWEIFTFMNMNCFLHLWGYSLSCILNIVLSVAALWEVWKSNCTFIQMAIHFVNCLSFV